MQAEIEKLSVGLPDPITLSVDTGTGWICPSGATNCFNLTYQGETKSVAEHVQDLANTTVLMDYDRDLAKLLTRAAPFLEYADAKGKGESVNVGVAIAPWPATGPATFWQTQDEGELATLTTSALTTLSKHMSFQGFSVFTSAAWFNQSQHSPATGTFPNQMSLWYLDHEIVLNTTKAQSWLAWARSRHLVAVYIAPHAGPGDQALISIPGKSGSKANEQKFCDFIHAADKQGLHVQLLSDPTLDVAFVRNCTLNGAV